MSSVLGTISEPQHQLLSGCTYKYAKIAFGAQQQKVSCLARCPDFPVYSTVSPPPPPREELRREARELQRELRDARRRREAAAREPSQEEKDKGTTIGEVGGGRGEGG